MLKDVQRKLEIAERIKQLREDAHYTQPAVAERVGVTLRAYQRWEQVGGVTWENLEKLAQLYDVAPDYILRGEVKKPATPDLSVLNGTDPRLRRIEEKLDSLAALVSQVSEAQSKAFVELETQLQLREAAQSPDKDKRATKR